MPRNMDRRIEIVFPVEDEQAKARILSEIIPTYWNDSIKSKVQITKEHTTSQILIPVCHNLRMISLSKQLGKLHKVSAL